MINNIIDFSLKNKLIIIFGTLVLTLWGITSFINIPIEAFPDVTDTTVQVIAKLPGRASEEIEKQVTLPIEIEFNGLPHATQIRSESLSGLSVTNIIFDDHIDKYLARQLVLEKLSGVTLPEGTEVSLGPFSTPIGEIYRFVLESDTHSPMELRTYEDWLMKPELKRVPGVADVTALGGEIKQYQVLVDPLKLKSLGLSLQDVFEALESSNENIGGDYLKISSEQFAIRGIGQFASIDDINDVVIKTENGIPVKIENVANVQIGPKIRLGFVGKDKNNEVVEGTILMRRGENPSRVLKDLKKKLSELKEKLPKGIKITCTYDREELIHRTLETVTSTVLIGIFLVFVVLLVFTGQYVLASIVTLTVPLSLLFAFILMKAAGVSVTLLSLGAVDFGIIIDGAVVMSEAIFVILASHEKFKENAPLIIRAGATVAKPILFAKAIIILSFLPLYGLERVEGRLFEPLALTMTFAVLGAIFFTLTIVPVLCSMFLKKDIVEKEIWIMKKIESIYLPLLHKLIETPKKVMTLAAGCLLVALLLVPFLGTEFMPTVEEGGIWIRAYMPVSVSFDEVYRLAPKIRKVVRSFPQVQSAVSLTGRSEDALDPDLIYVTEFLVSLKPKKDWKCSKEEILQRMAKKLKSNFPATTFYFSQPIEDNVDEAISGVKGQVAIKLFGSDLKVLEKKSKEIYKVMKTVKGADDLVFDTLIGLPQLLIRVDRDLCAKYGVRVKNVQSVIEAALASKVATKFIEEERRFDVAVRLLPDYRGDIESIKNIQVLSLDGKLSVPIGQLAKFEMTEGAPVIYRENAKRRGAVRFNVVGRDMGGLVAEAKKKVTKQVELPEGYSIVWSGQFESQERAMNKLKLITPLSILFIFVLLFAEFGSIRNSLLILSTVPLAAIGGILGLFLFGIHLSVSAVVGFIALCGVSVQNGIILVSVFKRLINEGHDLKISVIRGVKERLRPILMTSLLASMGLLPAALSTGTGSEAQKPFAIVIVFGMITAVILTLIVLPTAFIWIESRFGKKTKVGIEKELAYPNLRRE